VISRIPALAFGLAILLALLVGGSAHAATASWSLSPSTYDFGAVPLPGPSAPAVFTLTNDGEVDLPPPQVELSYRPIESREPAEIFEDDAYDCVVRDNLVPGESCKTKVFFRPVYPGPRDGTITFVDWESEVSPVSASFTAVGMGPIVSFSGPPESLTAVVGEGPSIPPKVLTVTNEGDANLSITGISLIGENASHFAIVGGKCQPGVIVAPGAACGIWLTYSPVTAGFVSAELELTDNAAHGYQTTQIQGLGVAPTPRGPVPHATFISQRPGKVSARRFATFRFGMEAKESVRFVCKLDRRPLRSCVSPTTFRHLALGAHVFRVRARTRAPDVSRAFSMARFRVIPRH
jgi:hypothetical protein